MNRVSLYRVIPFVRNSFVPVFVGRFIIQGGRVILEGRFSMLRSTRIGMSIWFGGVAVITCYMAVLLLVKGPAEVVWFMPLIGLGMFGFGTLLVCSGKWWARNDEAWLSLRISDALGNPSRSGSTEPIE